MKQECEVLCRLSSDLSTKKFYERLDILNNLKQEWGNISSTESSSQLQLPSTEEHPTPSSTSTLSTVRLQLNDDWYSSNTFTPTTVSMEGKIVRSQHWQTEKLIKSSIILFKTNLTNYTIKIEYFFLSRFEIFLSNFLYTDDTKRGIEADDTGQPN